LSKIKNIKLPYIMLLIKAKFSSTIIQKVKNGPLINKNAL
jgi:hypothetical protein